MQHTVEDLSPVKKKITVTVPASEVDAVLDRTTAQYRMHVALPGFRKGKAPLAMVGKRFSQDILSEATNELIKANLAAIFKELDIAPLDDLSIDENETPLTRGQEFTYVFSFELMPDITLPDYENIGVEEDEVTVEEKEIDEVIDRMRRRMAERVDVEEKRLAGDNDVVVLDFEGFDENGEPVEGVSGEYLQVFLGEHQVLPDFEALAKTVMAGDSGEGKVTFPENYSHAPLAGKTVTMKITVHSLQARTLPEVDENFAQKAGGYESVAALRESIKETYTRNRTDMAKTKAQRLLLDKLLDATDFPLPEGMIDRHVENFLRGRFEEMAHDGQETASFSEGDFNTLREEAQTEAAKYVKTHLFLLTVAKKEGVAVTPQDITMMLRQIARREGRELKEVQERYAQHNLFPALRDHIMAEKAIGILYDKASGKAAETEKGEMEATPANTAEKADDIKGGDE